MYTSRSILICCLALLTVVQGALVNSKTQPQIEKPKQSYRAATKGGLELYQDLGKCPEILGDVLTKEIQSYQRVANQIIAAATAPEGAFKDRTYNELAKFVDKFGQRLSGSQSLEDSIDYVMEKMKTDGYSRVWAEEAIVPHWIRLVHKYYVHNVFEC